MHSINLFSFSFLLILKKFKNKNSNFIILIFAKKHARTPSQVDISDFKALTKLDALQSLQKELNKLLIIAPQNQSEVIFNRQVVSF